MGHRILCYSDSPVYGGHEVTLGDAIEGLLHQDNIELTIVVARNNERFRRKLVNLTGGKGVIECDVITEPGDVFRALGRTAKVGRLSELFREHRPDLVMVSQGSIGLSACGLAAAKKIGVPLVSFLPMAHPVAVVRGKTSWDVRAQEYFYRRLYRLPDYFLTICSTTAEMLQNIYEVDRSRVFISYYGLDIPRPAKIAYDYTSNGSEPSRKRVGIIGRVEFHQKQHDLFFKAIAGSEFARQLDFVVIGDGPDLAACQSLTESLGLRDRVRYIGWVDNVSDWYALLDAVAMPSRFEGLPVVLIEALSYGLPVVATDVDGMKEFLPASWLFAPGDMAAMLSCLKRIVQEDQTGLVNNNQEIAFTRLRKSHYQSTFVGHLQGILKAL
jgi:glycosyltransferase involved in cell wall biosynthesis